MRISAIAQRLAGLFTVGLLTVSGASGASAVTFEFEADIVAVGGLLQPISTTNPFGHRLTGRITYDHRTLLTKVDDTFGVYQNTVTDVSLSIEALGMTWTSAGTGYGIVRDNREVGGQTRDRISFGGIPLVGPNTGAAGIVMSPLDFAFTLLDTDATVFDSLALPKDLDLSAFEGRVAAITFQGMLPTPKAVGGYQIVEQIVDARVTSLEYVTVPEPTTLAVLGLGLAGLGLVRRKRTA